MRHHGEYARLYDDARAKGIELELATGENGRVAVLAARLRENPKGSVLSSLDTTLSELDATARRMRKELRL